MPAGATINSEGYHYTGLNYGVYKTCRIIYEIHHGEIPKGMCIDHINGVRTDNRIENLRLTTVRENNFNRPECSNRKSTLPKGITQTNSGLYLAQVSADGNVFSKSSRNLDFLKKWVRGKREELHGEYANHGNVK